ncbi:MAG: hypothetical protein ACTHKV_14855 [Flavipsychrobacter sp.]
MKLYLKAALSCCLIFSACSSSVKDVADFNKWLNDPAHGCLKERFINGIHISAKYLPPSYMVLKDAARKAKGMPLSAKLMDSLQHKYDKVVTFMLTIGPQNKPGDTKKDNAPASIDYRGINDYGEYAKRFLEMNFGMDRYVSMYIDNAEYIPVLAVSENAYELSDDRNFILVFAPVSAKDDITKAKNYLFVYKDAFFDMGAVQLDFSGGDIAKANAITIAQ